MTDEEVQKAIEKHQVEIKERARQKEEERKAAEKREEERQKALEKLVKAGFSPDELLR